MADASKYYEIQDGKLVRKKRSCPICGPAIFMADHYDRYHCGNCKYTVFKRKGKKSPSRKVVKRTPRRRTKSN